MKEAYESLAGGIGRFSQSWFLPSLISVGLAAFLLFPAVSNKGVFQNIASLAPGERVALMGLLSLILALLLASSATPLYRILEGYALPSTVKDWKLKRHNNEWANLRDRVRQTTDMPIDRGVLREKLDRYPRTSEFLMPTKLGNALRSGEAYGREQYGLDTVLLWYHLLSAAPDELKSNLSQSRTGMDFFTGAFWLSPVFAGASIFAALYGDSPRHLLGLCSLFLCPLAYAGAVRAAALYAKGLRALVDTGRVGLAEQLGLNLPRTLNDEIALWESVSDFYSWGHKWENAEAWIATIDSARPANDPTQILER